MAQDRNFAITPWLVKLIEQLNSAPTELAKLHIINSDLHNALSLKPTATKLSINANDLNIKIYMATNKSYSLRRKNEYCTELNLLQFLIEKNFNYELKLILANHANHFQGDAAYQALLSAAAFDNYKAILILREKYTFDETQLQKAWEMACAGFCHWVIEDFFNDPVLKTKIDAKAAFTEMLQHVTDTNVIPAQSIAIFLKYAPDKLDKSDATKAILAKLILQKLTNPVADANTQAREAQACEEIAKWLFTNNYKITLFPTLQDASVQQAAAVLQHLKPSQVQNNDYDLLRDKALATLEQLAKKPTPRARNDIQACKDILAWTYTADKKIKKVSGDSAVIDIAIQNNIPGIYSESLFQIKNDISSNKYGEAAATKLEQIPDEFKLGVIKQISEPISANNKAASARADSNTFWLMLGTGFIPAPFPGVIPLILYLTPLQEKFRFSRLTKHKERTKADLIDEINARLDTANPTIAASNPPATAESSKPTSDQAYSPSLTPAASVATSPAAASASDANEEINFINNLQKRDFANALQVANSNNLNPKVIASFSMPYFNRMDPETLKQFIETITPEVIQANLNTLASIKPPEGHEAANYERESLARYMLECYFYNEGVIATPVTVLGYHQQAKLKHLEKVLQAASPDMYTARADGLTDLEYFLNRMQASEITKDMRANIMLTLIQTGKLGEDNKENFKKVESKEKRATALKIYDQLQQNQTQLNESVKNYTLGTTITGFLIPPFITGTILLIPPIQRGITNFWRNWKRPEAVKTQQQQIQDIISNPEIQEMEIETLSDEEARDILERHTQPFDADGFENVDFLSDYPRSSKSASSASSDSNPSSRIESSPSANKPKQ